jgi:hypothetical protein
MEWEEKVISFSGLSWFMVCQKVEEKEKTRDRGGACQMLFKYKGTGW